MDNTNLLYEENDSEDKDHLFIQTVHKVLELTRYKNGYKAVCELLGEPYYTKSDEAKKKKQFRYFHRFFDWDTDGRAWIIKKIYSMPQPNTKPGPKSEITTIGLDIIVKVMKDNRKHRLADYKYNDWFTTNHHMARCLGLYPNKFYYGKRNMNTIINDVKENVIPHKKFKNVTLEDIYYCCSQFNSNANKNIINVFNELKSRHLADYEKVQFIYNCEDKTIHQVDWRNPKDRERMNYYHSVCYDFLVDHNITTDKVKNLKSYGINPLVYYNYVNKMTEELGYTVFDGYVLHIIERNIELYCKDHNLDDIKIDDLRMQVNKLFIEEELTKAKDKAKTKGKTMGQGNNNDRNMSKNYSLGCAYIAKQYMEFEPYNKITSSLGYMKNEYYFIDLKTEEMFEKYENELLESGLNAGLF